MAWNESSDTQSDGTPGVPAVSSGYSQPNPSSPYGQNYEGGAPRDTRGIAAGPGPINPLIPQGQPAISQSAVALGAGMPITPLQSASQPAAGSDDDSQADDAVWVNRAKRIIAGTHGDPHRQVQLLQQLSVVYLKERYGRSVQADEV